MRPNASLVLISNLLLPNVLFPGKLIPDCKIGLLEDQTEVIVEPKRPKREAAVPELTHDNDSLSGVYRAVPIPEELSILVPDKLSLLVLTNSSHNPSPHHVAKLQHVPSTTPSPGPGPPSDTFLKCCFSDGGEAAVGRSLPQGGRRRRRKSSSVRKVFLQRPLMSALGLELGSRVRLSKAAAEVQSSKGKLLVHASGLQAAVRGGKHDAPAANSILCNFSPAYFYSPQPRAMMAESLFGHCGPDSPLVVPNGALISFDGCGSFDVLNRDPDLPLLIRSREELLNDDAVEWKAAGDDDDAPREKKEATLEEGREWTTFSAPCFSITTSAANGKVSRHVAFSPPSMDWHFRRANLIPWPWSL